MKNAKNVHNGVYIRPDGSYDSYCPICQCCDDECPVCHGMAGNLGGFPVDALHKEIDRPADDEYEWFEVEE